jgi:ketosteroid isomerase-like protein
MIVLTEVKFAAMDAKQDVSRVVDAVKEFFAAAAVGDLARVHTVVTPDFEAFEVGKRFTGDELIALLRGKQAAGTVYVWNVTEPKVRIDGRTAWVTYTNRGSITDGAGRREMQWLESVVLQQEDGGWRMRFLHSTRVP